MHPESSNVQNGSQHEPVDIKTDHTDSDSNSVYNNNISVLNELPSTSQLSQLSLHTADSVGVSSQYQGIQTPRLLDNNFTPKSTLSDMSTISFNPPPMSPLPPLPPSTMQPIISSNQHNNYTNYITQQHYMSFNHNMHYTNYTNHIPQQYSTKQISCPGKNKCPDKDCDYGHASPFDRENGQQLFCDKMDKIGDCPYGNKCSRYHRITWNTSFITILAGKCPYYHGRVDKINKQQSSHNYESKNQTESYASTSNYVLYSHGWRGSPVNRTVYNSVEDVYGTVRGMNKSYVVVHRNKIIMKNKLGFGRQHHWFYMCIGEAVFDKLLQIPTVSHYCIVWHQNCQCLSLPFSVNDFGKCLQKYDELKGCARAIISNGKPIKQTIFDNRGKFEIDNGVNEWLKSAFGLYYCRFASE